MNKFQNASKTQVMLLILTILTSLSITVRLHAQTDTVKIKWDAPVKDVKTTPTLQVVVNAQLRRGSSMHDAAFEALKQLECDYVRFCPWFPYAKLGVAELEAPKDGKTSWDFSLMDPIVEDFMAATKGHPVVMTFSTTPQWMWKADWYSGYPADPNMEEWGYNVGTELKDPSGKQVGEYFRRLFQWYTKGGFTDEAGKKFTSNHQFDFKYWEVLNEPDGEHSINPQLYNTIYDATVSEIRKVDPTVKFVGASLMRIKDVTPDFMLTFLDPKKHKPGIPLDYVSYHSYVWINQTRGVEVEQYTAFEQAKQFVEQFYLIDGIRKRLSPATKSMINEIGTIRSDDSQNSHSTIEPWYWGLSAATYGYFFGEMVDMGIDVVGMSQLIGYPNQFPCVTMIDWETNKPNLRYRTLQLIKNNFSPGDKMITWSRGADTQSDLYARAFITKNGKKKVLLVNMRNKKLDFILPGATNARIDFVDESAADGVKQRTASSNAVSLNRFEVAIVTWP
jgi:hypothetical protein